MKSTVHLTAAALLLVAFVTESVLGQAKPAVQKPRKQVIYNGPYVTITYYPDAATPEAQRVLLRQLGDAEASVENFMVAKTLPPRPPVILPVPAINDVPAVVQQQVAPANAIQPADVARPDDPEARLVAVRDRIRKEAPDLAKALDLAPIPAPPAKPQAPPVIKPVVEEKVGPPKKADHVTAILRGSGKEISGVVIRDTDLSLMIKADNDQEFEVLKSEIAALARK